MIRPKHRLILLFLLLMLLLSGAPSAAHGYLVRSIPADRAVLERAPTRLQYWFSEALEPRFSEIKLRAPDGSILATGGVDAQNNAMLALRLPPGTLADGAYIVELRPAFASDGHAVAESRVFFVGQAVSGIEGQAASTQADPFEVLWRALLLAGTFLIFGTYALYSFVLLPAWGNAAHPAGHLPPRVMRRLSQLIGIGFALAFFASLLALLQQSMSFFNTDAASVLAGGLWDVVRIGSRFGDVWNWRLLLLVALAALHLASLYYAGRAPAVVRPTWSANFWLAALLLGMQAILSHAAGSLVLPWIAMASHWLHSVAVAFWIGGFAALVFVLPAALAPYTGEARAAALLAAMRRFSRLVVGALLLVIATGIYNSSNWFYAPNDLASSYGGALFAKLAMMALLLLVAGLHHAALRPELAARLPLLRAPIAAAGRFGGTLRLELLVIVGTLGLAALLASTPIPQPDFIESGTEAPRASASRDGVDLQIALLPGGPGLNTVDLLLRQGDAALEDARVEVNFSSPTRDIRGVWHSAELVEDGLYVAAGDEIDAPGTWWALVDLRLPERADLYRFAFAWEISEDAAVLLTRPPSLLNGLALLLVLAASLFAFWPALGAVARRLNWHPASLLTAIGAIVLSTGLLVLAVVVVIEDQARFSQAILPPPQVINPTLPDATSVQRGATLFAEHCLIWQSVTDYRALINGLETSIRDQDIYFATRDGWRRMPACQGDLSEAQRWDIVNYVRTLRSTG